MINLRSRAALLLAAGSIAAALASCATRIPVGVQYRVPAAADDAVVSLRFVSNRRLELTGAGTSYYGGEHGALSAGVCQVAFRDEDDRGGRLLRVDGAPIDTVIDSDPVHSLVIYIHGYSEPFAKNCRRAALLQRRLKLDGRLLLFSWPSGNYLTYAQDVRDLEQSIDSLNDLLDIAARTLGPDRIVLVAHSLGSRGVVAALERRVDAAKFNAVVFVAPDIQRDVFLDKLPMLRDKVSNITVYMSDNDRALWLSTAVNASARLGIADQFEFGGGQVNFVDVTGTGIDNISGHMYHMFNPAVTEDLRNLLATDPADTVRTWERVPAGHPGFWQLQPVARQH